MKFLSTQLTYILNQGQMRRNINALLKYVLFVLGVIAVFAILFHVIMLYAEGRNFSWVTGLYWTLTVMSTLGFGDITFESDIGRIFTIIVLLSGIVLLLIMLPFAFIRFFYAPWLEAQIHTQCPRAVPPGTAGHLIICRYDSIAPNLIKRLLHTRIPYFVIEADSTKASRLNDEGISVIQGDVDNVATYEKMNVKAARMVFANAGDTANTNITLTVREIAPEIPIAAVVSNEDSIDILELSGANHVLPLKQILGEHLANRISVNGERARVVRTFEDWLVVEFTIHNTRFEGLKIRDSDIRQLTGMNIVGVWEHGHLLPADPDHVFEDLSVPVAIGTREQVDKLEMLLTPEKPEPSDASVLIIGGGKVGYAAAKALKRKDVTVFMIDCAKELRESLLLVADRVTIGDAADRDVLMKGGLSDASLVILSTNSDAVNIYLSIYCRRLNPDIRIVSRITHERNLEAIHRAGADFVLSYAPLGAESVVSLVQGRDPVVIGEGVELFNVRVPTKISGQTLAESRIGEDTGLVVLAIRTEDETDANPQPATPLPRGARLSVLGTLEQFRKFKEKFE
jgi:Trk K+ transport system NAD-binding subunit